MKANKIGKDEIVEPKVYKKTKFQFKDYFGTMAVLLAFFSPSILAKDVPSYTEQEKNIEIIRDISEAEVDTYYQNCYKTNDDTFPQIMGKMPAKKYIACWEKEIRLNMFLKIDNNTKKLLEETIDLFNLINEKTYTNLPKITLNYEPKEIEKHNVFKINIDWSALPQGTLGQTSQTSFLTTKGNSLVDSKITIANQLRENPELFCTTLIHELMHALFNFKDTYTIENYPTKSIMYFGEAGKFLSINDIYLMNIASWTKELTDKQKKEVKEFYADYEKFYNSCDGYIISRLYEKIQNQEILEN